MAGGEAESCTCSLIGLVPLMAGVPEIRPELELRLKPLGNGANPIDHVYGGVPPAAPKVTL